MDFFQKFLNAEIRTAEVKTFIPKSLLYYRNHGVDQIVDIDGLNLARAIAEYGHPREPSQTCHAFQPGESLPNTMVGRTIA